MCFKRITQILIGAFFICLSTNAIAQVSGKVVYNTILESQNFQELKGELIFKDNKSLFSFKSDTVGQTSQSLEMENPSSMAFEFNLGEPLASYHQVYIDREANEIISSERYFKDGVEQPCTTEESTDIFDWNITSETKEIASFQSIKATTSFRGRHYTAWFTPEIPINAGPWKFHGLPGLILEVVDNEKGVQFYLSDIEVPVELSNPIEPPQQGDRISIQEYAVYESGTSEEVVNMIKAKLPRGVNISNISVKETVTGIEREY